jgi:hypothetical protein
MGLTCVLPEDSSEQTILLGWRKVGNGSDLRAAEQGYEDGTEQTIFLSWRK